jgi:hypothetical protein
MPEYLSVSGELDHKTRVFGVQLLLHSSQVVSEATGGIVAPYSLQIQQKKTLWLIIFMELGW